MSRHEQDAVSLMSGLLLTMIGGLYLLTNLTSLSVDGQWLGPAVLIGIGLSGLLSTLRRSAGDASRSD